MNRRELTMYLKSQGEIKSQAIRLQSVEQQKRLLEDKKAEAHLPEMVDTITKMASALSVEIDEWRTKYGIKSAVGFGWNSLDKVIKEQLSVHSYITDCLNDELKNTLRDQLAEIEANSENLAIQVLQEYNRLADQMGYFSTANDAFEYLAYLGFNPDEIYRAVGQRLRAVTQVVVDPKFLMLTKEENHG